jgi:hypothetical protein
MHYVTVFDASTHPYRNLWFVFDGAILLFAGTIMAFKPAWLERLFRRPLRQRRAFRWFFFVFALVWTGFAGASIISDAYGASRAVRDGTCQITEGRVEHFHPMSWTGHDTERFDVNGISFSYSDYIVTAGFNITASHGGPIREGLPVRICYSNGEILRLEVAR